LALSTGSVMVYGRAVDDGSIQVGKFDHVALEDQSISAATRRVVMLHKPLGVVSATVDDEHETVINLIDEPWAKELHLAGRLDRFTSGLVILTNDSKFSESLTEPQKKVGKRYFVQTDKEITEEVITGFRKGMFFEKEKAQIAPAIVELVEKRKCSFTIYEGKHHQIKRMFARYDIKVIALHREAIGEIELDVNLQPGEWKLL